MSLSSPMSGMAPRCSHLNRLLPVRSFFCFPSSSPKFSRSHQFHSHFRSHHSTLTTSPLPPPSSPTMASFSYANTPSSSAISTPAGTVRSSSPSQFSRNSSASSFSTTSSKRMSLSSRSMSGLMALDTAAIEAKMRIASLDNLKGYNQRSYSTVTQTESTEYVQKSNLRGYNLIRDPASNKGTFHPTPKKIVEKACTNSTFL